MPDLRGTRKKLKIALGAMLAVDALAVGILLSPVGHSSRTRQQDLQRTWAELQAKTQQAQPLRGLDKKVQVADQEINQFYRDRIPSEYSAVLDQVGKLASQSGVKIAQSKYDLKDPEVGGLRPMLIEANFVGDYLQVVKFINAMERDKTFFILDSIGLGEAQGGTVRVQLRFETYLKSAA
jgi:hypothetical protein